MRQYRKLSRAPLTAPLVTCRFESVGEVVMADLSPHDEAIARGEPGYLDPDTGLFVMTSAHHQKRGYCCNSNCRHCPFK
jgi:hypothetical protein